MFGFTNWRLCTLLGPLYDLKFIEIHFKGLVDVWLQSTKHYLAKYNWKGLKYRMRCKLFHYRGFFSYPSQRYNFGEPPPPQCRVSVPVTTLVVDSALQPNQQVALDLELEPELEHVVLPDVDTPKQ